MEEFVLANYLLALKEAMKDLNANEELLNLLVPAIANPAHLKNRTHTTPVPPLQFSPVKGILQRRSKITAWTMLWSIP